MATFTVGLRSPPYLIELSKLQQVRMLWGRALPKILPSSRFPTLIVPTRLDVALASNFHKTNLPDPGTGKIPTLGKLAGLGRYQNWTGTVLSSSYAAWNCSRVLLCPLLFL